MTRLFDGQPATRHIQPRRRPMQLTTAYVYINANAEPPGQSHPPQIRIVVSIIRSPTSTPVIANIISSMNISTETKMQKVKQTQLYYMTRVTHKSGRRASNKKSTKLNRNIITSARYHHYPLWAVSVPTPKTSDACTMENLSI